MSNPEWTAFNESNIIELANLMRRFKSGEITKETHSNFNWLHDYVDDLKESLAEAGIIKIHPNGSPEFLTEKYKWMFREALEG